MDNSIGTSNNIPSTSLMLIEPYIINSIENVDSNLQLITNLHITNEVENSEFIPQLIHSLSSTSSSSEDDLEDDDLIHWRDNFDQVSLLRSLISEWVFSFNIPQNALNRLLQIL